MADGRVPFGAAAANTAAKTADTACHRWTVLEYIGSGDSHYWTILDSMPVTTDQSVVPAMAAMVIGIVRIACP
jgi:hypothetical protein